MKSLTERVVDILVRLGPEGITLQDLARRVGAAPHTLGRPVATAKKIIWDHYGAIVVRPVPPAFVYRMVNKDNPDYETYAPSAKYDAHYLKAFLTRIHREAQGMLSLVDGRSAQGKMLKRVVALLGAAEALIDDRDLL